MSFIDKLFIHVPKDMQEPPAGQASCEGTGLSKKKNCEGTGMQQRVARPGAPAGSRTGAADLQAILFLVGF